MSEPRDEIAEVLAVELHQTCPFRNEHIARLVNRKTGRKLASCPECYDISLIVADTKALAERDRRVAGTAVVEFAHWVAVARAYNGSDREHGQSLYNECLNAVLPTWALEFADRIERGE